jgi:hypothetical protein
VNAVAIGDVEIFLYAYFGTVHSLAGESAKCIHHDWRNAPQNRYNLAPARAWVQQMPFNLMAIPHVRRPERFLMSKSNLEDGVADAIAATALISVVLVGVMIWLSGLPS